MLEYFKDYLVIQEAVRVVHDFKDDVPFTEVATMQIAKFESAL
jgi:hypothetical protein